MHSRLSNFSVISVIIFIEKMMNKVKPEVRVKVWPYVSKENKVLYVALWGLRASNKYIKYVVVQIK